MVRLGTGGSMAYQATAAGELAQRVDCRNRVTCRDGNELLTPADKKRISADEELIKCVAEALDIVKRRFREHSFCCRGSPDDAWEISIKPYAIICPFTPSECRGNFR